MYFKPYYLGCLAHASYLLGGDNGEAAVIDPRRDVEEYLADAEAAGLTIKHVIETHLHADFVSGHVELARRTGATIYLGAKGGAKFPHHPVRDGEEITMGDVTLRFLETPGHTPESLTILAFVQGESAPRIAFTGDTLFIGDVGRPDLVGSKGFTAEDMARQMYRALRDKLLPLPDATEVWPAHGAGSACGKALSNDRVSTIGRERAQNPALRFVVNRDEAGFVQYATEGLSAAPLYFAHDAQKNREGALPVADILKAARALTPAEVEELSEEVLVLDTRSVADFGAGHLPGAVHIQLEGKFAPWVGNIVPPESAVIVVAAAGHEVETMTRLARVGYERIIGWLEGGMDAWRAAGGEIVTVPQVTPEALRARLKVRQDAPAVLDVRARDEWDAGHIEGAVNIPLAELSSRLDEVPAGPLVAMCGSGYRSSIACSLLQRAGRRQVANLAGGWIAWEESAGI